MGLLLRFSADYPGNYSSVKGIVFWEAAGEIVDNCAFMPLHCIFLERMSAICCSSCFLWRILVVFI